MKITDFKVTYRDRFEVCGVATFEDGVSVRFSSNMNRTAFHHCSVPKNGIIRAAHAERIGAVVNRINELSRSTRTTP